MWDDRRNEDAEENIKASEAGERRLQALESELREEEDRRMQERARLRAEELKRQRQQVEGRRHSEKKGAQETLSDSSAKSPLMSHSDASQIYHEVLLLAYREGFLCDTEANILALLRRRLGLTEVVHERLMKEVGLEIYSQAMVEVWQDGVLTREEFERLEKLREQLNISAEEHLRLEKLIRRRLMLRSAGAA